MDIKNIDLDKPAFGEGAQKVAEVLDETPIPAPEPIVEIKTEEEKPAEESEEEPAKVKYSRFKKFHDEAIQFRKEAEEWKAKAEELSRPRTEVVVDPQDEAYKLWMENFGDTETSRKAYENQLKIDQIRENRALEKAREGAIEAVRNERYEAQEQEKENLSTLDDHLDQVSAVAGRDLTEKEEDAILDIIDEFTSKDGDGKYSGSLLSPDKAWEIYELKSKVSSMPKRTSRDAVASLSGNSTPAESQSVIDERNKNFLPGNWGSWRDRLGS